MSPSLLVILGDPNADQILNSPSPIMRWGLNSDKLRNTPKITKYPKLPPKIIRMALVVDAKDSHVLSHIAAGVPAALKKYETACMQKQALSESGRALSKQAHSDRVQTTSRMKYGAVEFFAAAEWDMRLVAPTDKQIVLVSYVFPKNIQSAFEELFEETLGRFEHLLNILKRFLHHLEAVSLSPPPIFLRIVGPISMDLRPFLRGKTMEGSHVYSLGLMFLENLIYDAWTPWDLRSYEALVAAKIMSKGRLYPSAFASELFLSVTRLVEANLLLPFQFDAKEPQRIAVKAPAESSGLGVSIALTPRAGNDAFIKRAALMQQSLSAMINLSVRNLTSHLTHIGERPEFFGGFAEIWRAHLASSNGKVTVAVKYLRLYVTQLTKRLHQEIRIWRRLKHPHVLPLLGICHTVTSESIHASIEHPDPMSSIGIVCPWMENGTLVDFLKHRQTKLENIEELRLRLLIQICSGLMYLHSQNIVHGDLHGGNVLVDSEECARLADFGLSAVVAECQGISRTSPGGISSPHGGALRWAAPELFLPGGSEARLHTSADIYSVGGLILQACTGDVPYSYYNERRVLGAIITGEKPRRPTNDEANISDAVWSVIEDCWQNDPLKRPTAAALELRLQAICSAFRDEQA